jgi:hypothetical protein
MNNAQNVFKGFYRMPVEENWIPIGPAIQVRSLAIRATGCKHAVENY